MEDDRKSDRAVWGEEKGSYTFEDLKDYIQKKKREREIGGLSSAPPIPAGIWSFQWNSGGFWNLHRNVPRNGPEWCSPESARIIDLFVIYL